MGQLAREAGHHINWEGIEQQEMIKASIAAHFGNSKLLSVLICNNLIEFTKNKNVDVSKGIDGRISSYIETNKELLQKPKEKIEML
ncbi:hypothetical protein [Bartonella heixiaziensis]|uniref:hypothetical protein n=1 Tax=Bartonella heixiaziensis TaxID=1461000 RepID=UPI003D219FAB